MQASEYRPKKYRPSTISSTMPVQYLQSIPARRPISREPAVAAQKLRLFMPQHNTVHTNMHTNKKHAAPHKRLSRTRVLYLLNVVLYWYMYSCCRYVLVAQGSHDGSLKPRRHPMCRARQQLPVAGWHARPPAPRGGGRHLRHRRPAKALRLPEVLSAVQRVGTLQHARIYLSDYGLCARLATRLRA